MPFKQELYLAVKDKRWNLVLHILHDKSNHHQAKNICRANGYNALYLACRHRGTPIDVVRSLLIAYVDAALVRDEEGRSPLHTAMYNASDEVKLMVIESCPRAASIQDIHGDTPLHDATAWEGSTDVIRALLKADSSKATSSNVDGKTPIHMFSRVWNMALRNNRSLLETSRIHSFLDADIGKTRSGKKRKGEDIYDQACLLLGAASYGTTDEVLFRKRRLEVHSSIIVKSCPWTVFHMLLKIHPEQTWLPDSNGNLPIHLAAASSKTSSDGDLYECNECHFVPKMEPWYHDHTHATNNEYNYCTNCNEIIEFVEEDVSFKLIQPVLKAPATISDLLTINPKSASIPNGKKRLPLNVAIESKKEFEGGIETIFFACPEALETRDIETHMMPFMLAAVERKDTDVSCNGSKSFLQQFSTVFSLLMENPTLVSLGIR